MKKLKLLLKLFWIFFKIGAFTFGGGYAMLPLIQNEVVNRNQWVSEEEIVDIFAISQSVPGVIAINSAIFIGNKVGGFSGAIFAAAGVILPAFIAILLIFTVLSGIRDNPIVGKVFAGIRAAAAALILLAAHKLAKSAVKGKIGYIIAAISFLLIVLFDVHAMWAIVLGGITGYVMYLKNRRAQQ